MATLRLPEDVGKEQVDSNEPLLLYPGQIPATSQYLFEFPLGRPEYTVVRAFFDKALLMDAVADNGRLELKVVGKLKTGQSFSGTDTIWIIGADFKCLVGFALHWLEADCSEPDWCDGFDLDHNGIVNFADFALAGACDVKVLTD